MAHAKAKNGISALKSDAEQMAKDLSELTSSIADMGKDGSERITEELVKKLEDQLDVVTTRISALRGEFKQNAEKVDQHIKTNPYLYLLGAAGLGFFLGKILPSLKQS